MSETFPGNIGKITQDPSQEHLRLQAAIRSITGEIKRLQDELLLKKLLKKFDVGANAVAAKNLTDELEKLKKTLGQLEEIENERKDLSVQSFLIDDPTIGDAIRNPEILEAYKKKAD